MEPYENVEEEDEEDIDFNDEVYNIFDDMTLGVMQRNAEALKQQIPRNVQEIENAKDLVFRCDVSTPSDSRNRDRNGATTTIDLQKMAKIAMVKLGRSCEELPSKTCYIKEIAIESAFNNLPCDVLLGCNQDDKVMGNFCQGVVRGEEGLHTDRASLHVVHSGTQMHLEHGRVVHTATDFVNSPKFHKYLQALQKDIEDSTTIINGGLSVEYLSPWAKSKNQDDMGKGDWFVDVMYKNPQSFDNPVQAIRTPTGDGTKYVCSLRTHKDDWDKLKGAVETNVLQPLRANVIDLSTDPYLQFSLTPANLDHADATNTTKRSTAEAWKHDTVKGAQGKAGVVIRTTLKFV